jgi:hypothetical protein
MNARVEPEWAMVTVNNPRISRSTILVLSKLDPRVEPIAGVLQRPSDGDLTGWLQLTQMLEAVRRSAAGP